MNGKYGVYEEQNLKGKKEVREPSKYVAGSDVTNKPVCDRKNE